MDYNLIWLKYEYNHNYNNTYSHWFLYSSTYACDDRFTHRLRHLVGQICITHFEQAPYSNCAHITTRCSMSNAVFIGIEVVCITYIRSTNGHGRHVHVDWLFFRFMKSITVLKKYKINATLEKCYPWIHEWTGVCLHDKRVRECWDVMLWRRHCF